MLHCDSQSIDELLQNAPERLLFLDLEKMLSSVLKFCLLKDTRTGILPSFDPVTTVVWVKFFSLPILFSQNI